MKGKTRKGGDKFRYSNKTAIRNVAERTADTGANGGHCRIHTAGLAYSRYRSKWRALQDPYCRAGVQQIPEQMAGIVGSVLQGWRTADTGANGGHCRLRTAGLAYSRYRSKWWAL